MKKTKLVKPIVIIIIKHGITQLIKRNQMQINNPLTNFIDLVFNLITVNLGYNEHHNVPVLVSNDKI